jgi:predicted  nucleic acid-binding Zn-ribbon protein
VNNARHDILVLVRLQDVYSNIASAIRERNEAPPEVQELHERNRQREQELEELQERVEELNTELREARRREEEFKLELEHFQKQKAIVSNEREFTAVISEIDYATKGLQEAAARRSELETQILETEEEIATRRDSRPEEETAHREVVEGWEQRKNEIKQTIHDLAAEAKTLEADLAPQTRARFLRLLESKHGTAMAPLVEGSCSICHFSVRLHLQQRVRRCEELIFCEHCRRILYAEEVLDEVVPG